MTSLDDTQTPVSYTDELDNKSKRSSVVDFYENRSVLITGGSGFVGKVLVEKLLRTCPGIKRIYILIRPKWNKSPQERLQEILKSALFEQVRDLAHKVIVVDGDVTEPNLGLSEQSLINIINDVSVVVHSAATVKFDEPLKRAVGINIKGTKNMIDLCRKLPHLASFVHISTAYSNCDKDNIDEHVYPEDLSPEKLIKMADWLDQDTIQELKPRLLGQRPNTYVYTKALAEWLLAEHAQDLPVVICRPSIVVASWKEPFSGWIDNVNGPTGVILGAGKGLLRSMYANCKMVADLIPVDTVINLIVTLGWFAHIHHQHRQLSDASESSLESFEGSGSSSADEYGDGSIDHIEMMSEQTFGGRNDGSSNDNNNSSSHNYNSSGLESSSSSNKLSDGKFHHFNLNKQFNDEGYLSALQTPDNKSSASSTINQAVDNNLILEQNPKFMSLEAQKVLSIQKQASLDLKLKQFRKCALSKVTCKNLPENIADIPVFHCTSGSENPITWGQIQYTIISILAIYPSITTYRFPSGSFTTNKLLDDFYRVTLHYIPAYLADFVTRLLGGKPILVKIYNKFDQAARVLKAFTSKQWKFNHDNRLMLIDQFMTDEDRRLFDCKLCTLDWDDYLKDYVLGVRKFMLKEPMSNIEEARSNLNFVYYRNLSLQIISMTSLVYYFVTLTMTEVMT